MSCQYIGRVIRSLKIRGLETESILDPIHYPSSEERALCDQQASRVQVPRQALKQTVHVTCKQQRSGKLLRILLRIYRPT